MSTTTDTAYARALYELLEETPSEQHESVVRAFAKHVLKKKGVRTLSQIQEKYTEYHNEQSQLREVKVVSAHALQPQDRSKLQSMLEVKEGKKIILQESVDPNLLGGIKITIKDTVYDTSLRGTLDQLKTLFI